ncbi:MAG: hypothetical protein A3J24_04240 [Deltaproteobacteria bacterium RIFCSPLOWO2_02_FULL_53_8]|nr:MAG: hypothetical protein A3J24_04240 [Deltaproteobacteria bacterium RIFCSPLOWO2_02_FULL_53_8]
MGKYDSIDRFGIDTMNKADYQKRQDYVEKKCKCQTCPTYVKGDAPIGYCYPLVGTSKNIQWEKDCICGTCPIYKEYELKHTHYCTRCSHMCQALKTEVAGGQGGSG